MRTQILILTLMAVIALSCTNEATIINEFSSSDDTLIIQTEKHRGFGVFENGAIGLYSRDTSEVFLTKIIYPHGIDQLKRYEGYIDFALMMYHNYCNGDLELLERVEGDIANRHIDTTTCLSEFDNIINILDGYKDGERIVVVDVNNNKDLTDDEAHVVDLSWGPINKGFIEIQFRIYDGHENVDDKSWLFFRTMEGRDELIYGKAEHIVAKFKIDSNQYEVAAINGGTSDFTYDMYNPTAQLYVSLDVNDRQVVYEEEEFLQFGQYLKLGGDYYRIDDISHNGGELILTKETEFEMRVGTQVGMIAPEFKCATIFGDTITSSEMSDKGIIIVNMCGCGGDTESMAAYDSIASHYGKEYYVLGVDSQFMKEQKGLLVDAEDPYNQDFFENYRMMYCSRMTYVINLSSRIQQKFYSRNWRKKLDT